jgi:selenocysteine-specific elongation factor
LSPSSTQINITLGTAGHVDHGKTSLVKFLTGCDTDRLKEEKERGMSIELGFAPCTIRDSEVGIVDVPGHENFIKTMVAGASSMDGVILVVAADDGVMPQTREHLDILTLLGVRNGLVALTKIDRVDPARREEAQSQVRTYLRGTFLETYPILPMSNTTGEGYDAFREALEDLVSSITPRRTDGIFRLPVERAFAVKGYGTIVAGVPLVGQAKVGDELVLLPHNIKGRLRAVQVYQRSSEVVVAGQCAALNVPQWDHATIRHGHTVTRPDFFKPEEWGLCQLRLLPQEGVHLKNAARVRFHTGTSDLAATAYLMQGAIMQGGEEMPVQFRFEQPLVAGPGDHFIIRSSAPVRTLGGGFIVETMGRRLKRNQPAILQDAIDHAQAVGNEQTLVAYSLRTPATIGSHPQELAQHVKLPVEQVREILKDLVAKGQALELEAELFMDAKRYDDCAQKILQALTEFHQQTPASPGMTADELASRASIPKPILEPLVNRLQKEGRVAATGGRVALAGHHASVPDAERRLFETVELLFRARPYSPPEMEELVSNTRLKADEVGRIVRLLTEQGRLVSVGNGLWFHREAVDKARQLLEDHIRKNGRLESVQFKYVLNTTRKYALPLLDYFDRAGVTVRSHNTRYLR